MNEHDVLALNDMSLPELQKMFFTFFGKKHNIFSRKFYIYKLAYRMQEIECGGLPQSLKAALLNYQLPPIKRRKKIAIAGTKLVREYRGTEYVCTVLENGYEYRGRYYPTLSGVAREITGLKISGSFFFNLKKGSKKDGE